MFRYFSALLIVLLFSQLASAEVGFRQFRLNSESERPLDAALWYPTSDKGKPEQVGENIVFLGTNAQRDAKPGAQKHPLLLISHGYGGNWRNLNWLASQMAQQGYIVAAVDHPGTTTLNKEKRAAQQLWRRPDDLTLLLSHLLKTPELAGYVDPERIAAAGHSLGGWTVIELAGGLFSVDRFLQDCQTHVTLGGCKLKHVLGTDKPESKAPLAASQRDTRIKAVVSLDLGLARGFTPESLAQISIPVLVMGAQADSDDVPARLESGYLFDSLPQNLRRYVSVTGATHFSFMQMCKPGVEALIEAQDPGDGIVCRDGGSLTREAIHQQLFTTISQFLNQTLNYQPPHGESRQGSSH
ncbi:alpha/beta hydrolase family protein [Phytobacter sp. V91]|uniref:alpha/beta hydrolase family protein n=1 Tax=Phytobacter sp. V91 TaxID=3369425 RepID=UPI003F5FC097